MERITQLLEKIANAKSEMSPLEKAIQWGKIILGIVALGALAYIIYLLRIIALK